MPPKRAASSTGASKRQKTTNGNGSSSSAPNNSRWSAVSGTGNIYAGYIAQMAKDPEHKYTFKCLCRPPFPDGDSESDYESDEDSIDGDSSESEHANDKVTATGGKAPSKPRCDVGKSCLCKKPATEHPDHPWIFTHAGLTKFIDLRLCADLRCPDIFNMYTYNDHHGYGIIEVVENLILDFDEAKENWKEQWAICEAAVLFLLCGEADPMNMVDDGEKVAHVHSLIARMFLAMLAKLEAQDLLTPESEVKNFGVIMAIYVKYIRGKDEMPDVEAAKNFQSDQAPLHILAYAKKHGIKLRGPDDIDELVKEVEADQEEKVSLPAASAQDPWHWADGVKKYVKDHVGKLADMGGDDLDMTTWSSAERKKKSFDNKDCFKKKEIDALKDGMILQVR